MNRKERNKAKKILRRNLIAGTLLLFLLGLSIAGATGAWFTNGSITLQNLFTAGTVLIEAKDLSVYVSDGEIDVVTPGDTIQKTYNITNQGSKSIYVRARFLGYWEKLYHRNVATVTASYGTQNITDSDDAHFYFIGNNEAANNTVGNTYGFTSVDTLNNTLVIDKGIANDDFNGSDDQNSLNDDSCDPSNLSNWKGPDPVTSASGRGIIPITGDEAELLGLFGTAPGESKNPYHPDPNAALLPTPENCDLLYFKVEGDQDDINNGDTFSGNGFEVTIYKQEINGKDYFAFKSNHPVFHLYAKGGNQGGYLYSYYNNSDIMPNYPNGVVSDCGLSQPGGDWSHISFYYCEVPAININKYVSIDGGNNWVTASQSPGPLLPQGVNPKFKFVVKNTGTVPLTNVVVTDNVYGQLGSPFNLQPGGIWEHYFTDTQWEARIISLTNKIKLELCDNMDKWTPDGKQDLGTYFYHTDIIKANVNGNAGTYSVDLCIKIHSDSIGSEYDGSTFKLYSYFEAVQASNNMIWHNWKDDLTKLGLSENHGWWVN